MPTPNPNYEPKNKEPKTHKTKAENAAAIQRVLEES
jgi:hypothetical protein